jgi:hypothetical protein
MEERSDISLLAKLAGFSLHAASVCVVSDRLFADGFEDT